MDAGRRPDRGRRDCRRREEEEYGYSPVCSQGNILHLILLHGIVSQLNDGIPDSKYQGYLGPQGALDSPSGSHRAHWKFRKVIKVEIATLIIISSSSKPNLLISKGDKRRHTMNVDLEACEEDQDTLKGVFKHFGRVTKLLCIGATLISN